MKVLVTGGAGYVGCCLVPELTRRGHSVRIFDRFIFGEDVLASLPLCEIVRGDIRRLQEVPGLLDGVEAVVHLADLSGDAACALNPEMAYDVNVESTRELVSQCVQAGVRRFILASTCHVYGQAVFDPVDEGSPTNPVSIYGETKCAAEKAVLEAANGDLEAVVARLGTLFGWSPRMRFDLAVNQMVATALRENVIRVLEGGNQWRPLLHVEDAARALADLLERPSDQVAREIFNVVSTDLNYRMRDLAQSIAPFFPNASVEIAKAEDDRRSFRVSGTKLGLACRYTIEDGVKQLRERILSHTVDPFDERHFNGRRMQRLLQTPVEDGGEPIAARFIPMAKPLLGAEEETAVINALRSGWLTSGPQVGAFEKAVGHAVSSPHVIAVNSCTAALHLCLVHAGVKPGDEVITSPITWASTGNTIINMGAKVVFADIRPDTLNIDPEAIERAITPRTRVIMPVHLAGQPADLDRIYDIARRHGIAVVEDAAHALGARYRDKAIGQYGDFTCFSFYAIKNITTMEGGAIALKDEEAATHMRLLAANGMSATAWQRYGRSAEAAPPEVVEPGFKYLMGNVSAAMGLEQMKKLDSFLAARRRLAHLYRTVLPEIEEIELPVCLDHIEHAWHLMIVRLKLDRLDKSRNEVAAALRRENIGTGVHFYGLHLHPYYRETLGTKPEDLPEATRASHEILSLPLHPAMTDKDVRQVTDALKKVLAHAQKSSTFDVRRYSS